MSLLPHDLARVHVVSRDPVVRGFDQRQALNVECHRARPAESAGSAGTARSAPSGGPPRPPPNPPGPPGPLRGPRPAPPLPGAPSSSSPGSVAGRRMPPVALGPGIARSAGTFRSVYDARMRMDVEAVGFRIERAARPVRAADLARKHQCARRAIGPGQRGWRIERPNLVLLDYFQRLRPQLRREID